MTTYRSLGAFGLDVERLAKDLGDEGARKIAKTMGEEAQRIAKTAAARDLGADIMHTGTDQHPGWRQPLETNLRPQQPGVTMVVPSRRSAGPWTVAEQGRNQGNASGVAGPGINQKTGLTSRTSKGALRKVSARKARKWNGRTKGKHTGSGAVSEMERELPKIAEREVRKVIRRYFR